MVNVLITGVGAPGTTGTLYALKNNPDGEEVNIFGTDIKENPVGKYFVSRFYKISAPEDQEYIERLNSICSENSIDVVIPQTTRETSVLSKSKESVECKVVVTGQDSVDIANNKFELMKRCENIGVPCPRYYKVHALADLIDRAEEFGYPAKSVVVKPPVSFGSRGLRILKEYNSWSIRRFLSEKPSPIEMTLDDFSKIFTKDKHVDFPEMLVTEYLPGKEYSVDVFRGEKASVAIPRLRAEIVNGISFKAISDYRNDLIEYSLKISNHLNLKYAFGFQFKLDYSDTPKILECNPRVQGTMVASVFSGVNVIWLAVKEAIGQTVDKIPTPQSFEFLRYWGGIGVTSDNSIHNVGRF
ncbi:MAG: ATP-grasp domain-containing protein [Nitrososphaerota archaeon]|nr:ATP-grasp domain-containing protein [Nitrososphaerota archaeon]